MSMSINHSECTKNLMAAFATFQGLLENVKKDSNNPFFKSKYADLASIFDEIRPKLAATGLAVSQWPQSDGSLVTILMHESGEWLEGTYTMTPADSKPQSLGSAITYARRYALGAILGVASEEDDDGNASSVGSSEKTQQRPVSVSARAIPVSPSPSNAPMAEEPRITLEQQDHIVRACSQLDALKDKSEGWTLSYLCGERWKLNTIDEMPETMAGQVMTYLDNQIRKEMKTNGITK